MGRTADDRLTERDHPEEESVTIMFPRYLMLEADGIERYRAEGDIEAGSIFLGKVQRRSFDAEDAGPAEYARVDDTLERLGKRR